MDTETRPAPCTPEQIDALKQSWLSDPHWDIEDAEGFEAHRDELLAFRDMWLAKWDAKRREQLEARAEQLGCPGNLRLAIYVMNLETQLEALDKRLDKLESK